MPAAFQPEVRLRLRSALFRWAERFPDPKRAQSAMAKKLQITPSALNRIMAKESSGGSLALVYKVASALNEPPELILNGESRPAPIRQLRELAGFAAEFEEAKRRAAREHPQLTLEDLEGAADIRAEPEPPMVTAGLLIQLALAMRGPIPPTKKSGPRTKS